VVLTRNGESVTLQITFEEAASPKPFQRQTR
jgi:hypothetical protein